MPIRATLLFAVTTNPTDLSSASPHSGGWSESFYLLGSAFQTLTFFQGWASVRASLLAQECSVQGYRQQNFTISGNKLLPGGSGSGVLNQPGAFANDLNVPQDSLMINLTVNGQPNNVRHRLAGLPDSQISNGEYQPSSVFKGNVTKYFSAIIALGFQAVTRDLTQPEARVKEVSATTVTTLTATGAAAGDYLRLRRVRDDSGVPISGTFLVTAVTPNTDGSFTYTCFGLPGQTATTPNGLARKDILVINPIIAGIPNRAVVRKIGRPFVQYRGRRSKIRR